MIDARLAVIGKYKAYDYESIIVADSAVGLTSSKLNTTLKPKRAFISLETAQVRYRYDGSNPTDIEGHILNPVVNYLVVEGYHNLVNFKAIRTGATSGTLRVTYEK
jgi:hypothetical protein